MSELVMVQNNQVVVSSRQVAEHFGKRHDKLYSEIKRMYAEFISVGEGNAQNGGDPLFYEAEYYMTSMQAKGIRKLGRIKTMRWTSAQHEHIGRRRVEGLFMIC